METNILKIMQQQEITFLIPKNKFNIDFRSDYIYKLNSDKFCFFVYFLIFLFFFLFLKARFICLTLRLLREITS